MERVKLFTARQFMMLQIRFHSRLDILGIFKAYLPPSAVLRKKCILNIQINDSFTIQNHGCEQRTPRFYLDLFVDKSVDLVANLLCPRRALINVASSSVSRGQNTSSRSTQPGICLSSVVFPQHIVPKTHTRSCLCLSRIFFSSSSICGAILQYLSVDYTN